MWSSILFRLSLLQFIFINEIPLQAAEAPLTNEDAIKLSKLDLGDDLIISKINQSKNVGLNFDTDSLIKLKKRRC